MTPQPEPTPEPTPSPEPASNPDLSGADTWAAVLEMLERTKPIAAAYAQKAAFLEEDGRNFTIAVDPSDALTKDSLLRDRTREAIEAALTKIKGEPRRLRVELKEGIQPVAPPPEFAEEEEPPPANLFDSSPPPTPPEPTPSADPSGKSGSGSASDDIYDDPLIKEALDLFEAEIKT